VEQEPVLVLVLAQPQGWLEQRVALEPRIAN
jgi:hypothetical protein